MGASIWKPAVPARVQHPLMRKDWSTSLRNGPGARALVEFAAAFGPRATRAPEPAPADPRAREARAAWLADRILAIAARLPAGPHRDE